MAMIAARREVRKLTRQVSANKPYRVVAHSRINVPFAFHFNWVLALLTPRELLTSRLSSDLLQQFGYRLMGDVRLCQNPRPEQRDAALLEVDDHRAADILTFVRTCRHLRRQAPLQSAASQYIEG